MSKPDYRQRHYNEMIRGLGIAMKAIKEAESGDEKKAQKALKDFVINHYLPVWRSIDQS